MENIFVGFGSKTPVSRVNKVNDSVRKPIETECREKSALNSNIRLKRQ